MFLVGEINTGETALELLREILQTHAGHHLRVSGWEQPFRKGNLLRESGERRRGLRGNAHLTCTTDMGTLSPTTRI